MAGVNFDDVVKQVYYLNSIRDGLRQVVGVQDVSGPQVVDGGLTFTVRVKPMSEEVDGEEPVKPKRPDELPRGGMITVLPRPPVVFRGTSVDRTVDDFARRTRARPYHTEARCMAEAVWGVSSVLPEHQGPTTLSAFVLLSSERTAELKFASVFTYSPPGRPEVNNIGMAAIGDVRSRLVGELAVIKDDLPKPDILTNPQETKRLMGLGIAIIDERGDMTVVDAYDDAAWRKAFLAALRPGVVVYGSLNVEGCRPPIEKEVVQSVSLIAVVGEQNVAVGHRNYGALSMGAAQVETLYKFLRGKYGIGGLE